MWSFSMPRKKGKGIYSCLIHASRREALCSPSPKSPDMLHLNNCIFGQLLSFLHFTILYSFTSSLIHLLSFLCLRGNSTHPKMLHYNVTSFILLFLVTLSYLYQKAPFSPSFSTLLISLLYVRDR